MNGQTIAFLEALLEQTGVAHLSPGNLIIIAVGLAMIMGPNLAGVFGTAISGGIMLALLGIN